eukprot:PITA_25243
MSTPMITNWKMFHASDSSLVDPTLYRHLIGSFMYLVNNRPDICFVVNTLSQRMVEPKKVHWVAAKHILRYVRKQKLVALSSSEAEYMAASQASCDAIWLRKLLYGLFDQELRPTIIQCDNQSCIKLTENPVFHDRSKHVDIIYHFIRDYVQKGAVKLEYMSTNEQVADVLMKSLPRGKHLHFRDNGCGEKHFPR